MDTTERVSGCDRSQPEPVPADLVVAWGQALAALEPPFADNRPLQERADRVADLVYQLAPDGLAACLLWADGPPVLACRGAAVLTPEGEESLRQGLLHLDPRDAEVRRLEDLEKRLCMRTQAVAITHGGRGWGHLLLGRPESAGGLDVSETLLLATARTVGLRCHLEAEAALAREAHERLAEVDDVALLGDAALMLAHDLNDVLNTMILQASLVQMKVDAQRREELGMIRQQGRKAAWLLQPLQQTWQQRRHGSQTIDLNTAIRHVVAEGEAPPARLELADGLPAVPGTRSGLRRLVGTLLRLVASRQGGPVLVRTLAEDKGARLLVGDADLLTTGEELINPFDAENGLFGGATLLEGLALQSLLRQSGGKLKILSRPDGALAVTVTWG
jgi:hypothetical protein